MGKKHILKSVNRALSRMRLIFFDVETETVSETKKEKVQGFQLVTANYCVYRPEGGMRTIESFQSYSQVDFFIWVRKHIQVKKLLYVLSANIWFDIRNSGLFMTLIEHGFVPNVFHVRGLAVIIKLVHQSGTIIFLNMQQLIPVSVKAYGEMVGLSKLEVDLETDNKALLMEYCQRDTDIITKVFGKWMDFLKLHDLGRFSYTMAGQAFLAYRYRFMNKVIYIHNHEHFTKFERKCYLGGRTECFYIGKLDKDITYYLDINSMYPFVMRTQKMPTRILKVESYPKKVMLHYWLKKYHCLAYVAIDTNEPVYPLIKDHRLCFPIGRFSTYLCHAELEYAFSHGHIHSIGYIALYQKTIIFDEYIKFFHNLKRMYEKEGNKSFRFMTKRMMNSLYGKFAQRIDVLSFEDSIEEPRYSHDRILNLKDGKWYRELVLGHSRKVYEEGAGEAYDGFVAISASITSAARIYLWSLMKEAGRENVFYCDTDSMLVNPEGYERLSEHIQDNVLGKLTLEKTSHHVTIHSAKDYVFGGDVKIKGVGKRSIKRSDGGYSQLQFPSFKGDIKRGLNIPYAIKKIIKYLRRDYRKGTVLSSGVVKPYRLNDY